MRVADVRKVRFEFLQERLIAADKIAPGAAVTVSCLTLAFGFLALARNSFDAVAVPTLALQSLALAALMVQNQRRRGAIERETAVLLGITVISMLFLLVLPEWLYGRQFNAIVHRSLFSSAMMMAAGAFGLSHSIYHLLGATPTARDVAQYPLLILPVALVMVAYVMVLGRVIDKGAGNLSVHTVTTAYDQNLVDANFVREAGLRNHILGTFLLLGMTIGIALPIGVGAGLYMSEYPGWTARLIGFSATMLRAISVFIIGAAALNMVQLAQDRTPGDPISDVIRGYYHDDQGFIHASQGSFLLAACFLAILVIPVIARATEEGFQSVPREIREGSMALGATDGHGLLNIYLPWALPIILTGTLIAAAEAAGSTAVLLFISGTGENGVGPLKETASLDFLVFQTRYGPQGFVEVMRQYQYTAALLLLMITLSFTALALYVKARARRRYRGIYAS